MGFINDLKKALFGAKSTLKHAGEEASEQGREMQDKAEDWLDQASEKTAGTLEELDAMAEAQARKLQSRAEDLDQKAQELFNEKEKEQTSAPSTEPEDVADALFQSAEEMEEEAKRSPAEEDPLDEFKGFAERTGKKLGDAAEDLSERIMDKNREEDPEWMKKAKEKTESLGEDLLKASDKAWEKAEEKGRELKGRFGEWVDKANEAVEREKAEEEARRKNPKTAKDIADQAKKDTGSSLLGGHGDFFERAARYADGDYRGEGEMRIEKSDEPKKKKENPGKLKGFEDRDGDGDELIDDAILDDKDD